MIDTGASWVAMNIRMTRKLGINYRDKGDQRVATTADEILLGATLPNHVDLLREGQVMLLRKK